MRTISNAQSYAYASGHVAAWARVYVKNSGGSYVLLSDILGRDFVKSVDITDTIDTSTMTCRVKLFRQIDDLNLSPLVSAGYIYSVSGGGAAMLACKRAIKIEAAVLPSGSVPASSDWLSVFEGAIDQIELGGENEIDLSCRDYGGALLDKFIETQKVYGTAAGTSVEGQMQQILTDNSTGVTMWTPTSPSWNVKEWIQDKEPCLTALQKLAHQIGWECRYKWDSGTSAWRLKFYEPDRAASSTVRTFTEADYTMASPLIDASRVRNKIRVVYTDSATDTRTTTEASDAASISLYGTLFCEIQEDTASNIDTSTEANKLRDAVLADLKDCALTQRVDLHYPFIHVETGDYYKFSADNRFYSSDQSLAVQSFTLSFSAGNGGKTSITCTGKPAGALDTWYQVEARPGQGQTADLIGPIKPRKLTQFSLHQGMGSFHRKQYANPVNRCLNGDFQAQSRVTTGSGWPPDNWTVATGTWGPSGDVYVSTSPLSGQRCLHFRNTSTASVVVYSDWMNSEAYGINFGFWVKDDGAASGTGNIDIKLERYTPGGAPVATLWSIGTHNDGFNSNAWTEHGYPYIGNDGYMRIKITRTLGTSTPYNIYVDRIGITTMGDAFSAYLHASQSIAASAWATVIYDTLRASTYSCYNTGTGIFTAPTAGIYQLNANVLLDSTADGIRQVGRIQQLNTAGSWIDIAWDDGRPGGAGYYNSKMSAIAFVDTSGTTNTTYGRQFRVQFYHENAGAKNATGDYCFFNGACLTRVP